MRGCIHLFLRWLASDIACVLACLLTAVAANRISHEPPPAVARHERRRSIRTQPEASIYGSTIITNQPTQLTAATMPLTGCSRQTSKQAALHRILEIPLNLDEPQFIIGCHHHHHQHRHHYHPSGPRP
ncbi:uncharacterized protein F4822DRAFT_172469 [Hypoxylon trugodes]|uniref:uncharacterized protein n=1 Tax=Hypoxylon trugodes TaxID=326681 RepID=UPI00219DE740|nr:uncharacterized protein F4822DRAFT_172469 [Hypoxylon trugodes]KAI1391085.1 hypothetical protein F4822DRAFT_172469 [Hypoxylon trugodes]